MPRRGGKSAALAQACAAVLMILYNAHISLFAPSSRAGASESGMAQLVYNLLKRHFKLGSQLVKNEDRICVQSSVSDERKMFFYSCYANKKYVLILSFSLSFCSSVQIRFFVISFSLVSFVPLSQFLSQIYTFLNEKKILHVTIQTSSKKNGDGTN
jgi:hypothetical protein